GPAPLPQNRESDEGMSKRGAVASGRVEQVLLAVVADKTGYPPEMLDLDMGLDADLGIDSIKRVEILSALQERLPEAPAVKPEHLGTLQTLRQIVEFLCETRNAGPARSASEGSDSRPSHALPAREEKNGASLLRFAPRP